MIKTRKEKSYLVVEVKATSLMTALSIKELQPQLFALIDDQGHDKIIIDLSSVRDISSQFIGLILAMHEKLQKTHGKLVLCGLSDKIKDLMSLTRLDRVITIKASAGDSVERDCFLG